MKTKFLRYVPLAAVFFTMHAQAQVVINEYSCSNLNTLSFSNTINSPTSNDYDDWIELYNTTGAPVDVMGWYLSDNSANPTRWQIPSSVVIPANGVTLFFASGLDTILSASSKHTNFKLTQTKFENIVLSDPSGLIKDSLTIKPALKDNSRGRTTNGAATWSVFTTPTPNAANASAMQEYAVRPVMSVAPGFYAGAQTVTITAPDPIHYTLNGNEPTIADPLYSAPLSIAATTCVRARAFSSNPAVPASFVESNTYFIGVTHATPVVSVFSDQIDNLLNGNGSIFPETVLEYFDATGAFKTESYGTANEHGNDSWFYSQRGFDYVDYDDYGYNYAIDFKVFSKQPRTEYQRLIFKAAANDNYPFGLGGNLGPAHIRDSYVHTLSQRANLKMEARSWEPAVVYVNGQYWGVYDVREKVDDSDYLDYYFNSKGTKSNYSESQMLKTWGGTWSEFGGPQAQTDWNTLRTFIIGNNMAVQANWDYMDSLYNWKSLADYVVLNSYCVTTDWLNWNTQWWRGRNPGAAHKKWRYTLWDEDATFDHYINYTGVPSTQPNADPCNADSLPDPGGQGHIPILNALMANPTYSQYYISRYIDLANTYFGCTYMLGLLDSMVLVITPEMTGQTTRWGGTVAGWMANVNAMKAFIQARCDSLAAGLIECYALTGPYNLTFDVQPAGSGNIQINSITPASYVYSGSYFGGGSPTPLNIILQATPNSGWVFDYWEMPAHTPSPNTTADSVTFNVSGPDAIVAHFREVGTPSLGAGDLFVPNAFSPNGDYVNDLLYVLGGIQYEGFEFSVFNRWGQRVFYTNDRATAWDGNFSGKPLQQGVYAYKLKYILNGSEETQQIKSGNITLVR